ncbi:hypothetical protein P8971_23205 [Serratia marcescens]|uniref:hypothetical protein n=1 Tax=Serratia marcescens TaxID=615 RepID=UPI0032049EEC
MYDYLTSKPGSNPKMWFKEHSPHHRELISYRGKVIAIWRSSQNAWRKRTDEDDAEDWDEYSNETGDHFITGGDFAFHLSTRYP